jgi:hypothetical protein
MCSFVSKQKDVDRWVPNEEQLEEGNNSKDCTAGKTASFESTCGTCKHSISPKEERIECFGFQGPRSSK